jgi:hypothetical protein
MLARKWFADRFSAEEFEHVFGILPIDLKAENPRETERSKRLNIVEDAPIGVRRPTAPEGKNKRDLKQPTPRRTTSAVYVPTTASEVFYSKETVEQVNGLGWVLAHFFNRLRVSRARRPPGTPRR